MSSSKDIIIDAAAMAQLNKVCSAAIVAIAAVGQAFRLELDARRDHVAVAARIVWPATDESAPVSIAEAFELLDPAESRAERACMG